jgi:hypothetical protein
MQFPNASTVWRFGGSVRTARNSTIGMGSSLTCLAAGVYLADAPPGALIRVPILAQFDPTGGGSLTHRPGRQRAPPPEMPGHQDDRTGLRRICRTVVELR